MVHQALLSMGFSRQKYWSGVPCPPPGDLPNPGIKSASLNVSCSDRQILYRLGSLSAWLRGLTLWSWITSLDHGLPLLYQVGLPLLFFFSFNIYVFSWLTGLQLQHVGSSSPTRDRTQATLQWELGVLAKDYQGSPKLAFLKQHYLDLSFDWTKFWSLPGECPQGTLSQTKSFGPRWY